MPHKSTCLRYLLIVVEKTRHLTKCLCKNNLIKKSSDNVYELRFDFLPCASFDVLVVELNLVVDEQQTDHFGETANAKVNDFVLRHNAQ